jgi:hypothetical protein
MHALDIRPIRVEIDDRERASGVAEGLRSLGVIVDTRRLLLGDDRIDGALRFERKSRDVEFRYRREAIAGRAVRDIARRAVRTSAIGENRTSRGA